MTSVELFDVIMIVLIVILGVKGVINGFVREVFGLLGLVGGIMVASRYAVQAGELINEYAFPIDNKSILYLLGFICVLFAIWSLFLIIGFVISKLVSVSGLGVVDMIAGFIVGCAKIFLLFSILFTILSEIHFVNDKMKKYVENSYIYPKLLSTGQYIIKIDINDVTKQMQTKTQEHFE